MPRVPMQIDLPRRFQLIAFDWDGTLADSTALIADAIQRACRDMGMPVPDGATARHVIGLGLHDSISYVAPDLARADYERFADRYRHYYLAGDSEIPLFDGVREMLAELEARGFLLAVATGKTRKGLARSLTQHAVAHHFVASRCADEGFPKPHPDMLLTLMDLVGVGPTHTLMVGDTTHDLQLAHAAGASALAVTYGAHETDGLTALSPLATIASLPELRAWLATNA
jgi:phosphoglycolate phosphatase